MNKTPLERRWLAALFLLLGLFYAWLLLSRRLPRGHDALSLSYMLHYLFLSHASTGGGIPLWLPYSSHGILTSWYAGMGGGLFLDALILVGVKPGANAQILFHLGQLFEEILLLLGTWRLGGFFFRSPFSRFFVTVSVVGSSFWGEQLFHGHRAVIAIPLALSFLLSFLESGRRRDLFLGGNLLVLQFLGNPPYTAAMTILVVAAFVGTYVVVFRRRLRLNWPRIRPRPLDALVIAVNVGVLAAILTLITSGTGEAVLQQPGRAPDGTVTIDHFLSHAGGLDPIRFADLMLGVSPMREFTLFIGVAAVPLALVGIARRPGRKALYWIACFALVFLLSMGTLSIVAMIAYYVAPPLHFYRYVTTAGVYVRIPLIFLAGLGIEGLRRAPAPKWAALLPALAGVACLALAPGSLRAELPPLLRTPSALLGASQGVDDAGSLAALLACVGIAALATAALLRTSARRPAHATVVVAALVLLQTADLVRWRIQLYRQRTVPLTSEQYAAQELRPLPYIARRSAEPADGARARALTPGFFGDGMVYDLTENFIPRDPPASAAHAPYLMASVDRLLRAYARGGSARPALWRQPSLRPPYDKVLGVAADKLQVFADAHVVESEDRLSELMNHPDFRGDVLLVAPVEGASSDRPAFLGADERVEAGPEVVGFDANSLRARIAVPRRAWLLYCDAWHSSWRATVNGKPVPVARAFLAYKAVPLEPGSNDVEFRIEAPARVWTFRLAAFTALLWVAGILGLSGAAIFRKAA